MIATHVCRNDAEIEKFGKTWREAVLAEGLDGVGLGLLAARGVVPSGLSLSFAVI